MSTPTRADARARLASVVGDDEAERVLVEAERAMQVSSTWDAAAADAVVGYLTMQRGVVGAAARLLRARARPSNASFRAVGTTDQGAPAPRADLSGPSPASGVTTIPSASTSLTPGSGVKTVFGPNAEKLVAMLKTAVGDDQARTLLLDAMSRRAVDPSTMTAEQGLNVLEDLSHASGAIGTAARFAKARAHFELA